MDGELPQQNSDVHPEFDIAIGSPGDYHLILQDLDVELDDMLGPEANTDMDITVDANAAAAEQQDSNNNGGDMAQSDQREAARRSKRHSREQLVQLEDAFGETQHPDDKQRADLGRKLGMSARQVKFWFQNRRASQKAQDMRKEEEFQVVNGSLQAEHQALRLATQNNTCLTCLEPTVRVSETQRQLLSENEKLEDELRRATAYLNNISGGMAGEVTPPITVPSGFHGPAINRNGVFVGAGKGKALATDHALPPPPSHRAHPAGPVMPVNGGFARSRRETDALLKDFAAAALQEFSTLASVGMPMWLPTPDGEILNFQKYAETMFPSLFGPYRMGCVVDGTRETGDVMCAANDLVGILMDGTRWSEMFPGIVASTTTSRIITPSQSASQHGMIQLMDAELMVLSPRVPVRKIKFVRQCQMQQPGKWAVVDVSVDGILRHDGGGVPPAYNARLLPSGCLIEDRNNGRCKVTWILNMEYEESTVSLFYHPLLRSGQALGACRWLASLQRQYEYLGILHSHVNTADISPDGRRKIFEVARRMTRSFYEAMCGPGANQWSSNNGWRGGCGIGYERFELAAHVVTFSACSGTPDSIVLSATTTVWIPGIPAQHVFDYLCNENRRGEWDSLANGAPVHQEGYFATGQLPGNAISFLRTIASDRTKGNLILQEARTDRSSMVLVYATLDDQSMQHAMSNGGPTSPYLLPSGLAILPDGHSEPVGSSSTATGQRSNTGSFISAMYQTLLIGQPPDTPSLEAIDNVGNLLCRVIRKIKEAVHANNIVDMPDVPSTF